MVPWGQWALGHPPDRLPHEMRRTRLQVDEAAVASRLQTKRKVDILMTKTQSLIEAS